MTDSFSLLINMLFDIECLLIPISLIIYCKRFEKKIHLILYTIYQISDIFFAFSYILIHFSKTYFLKQIHLTHIKNIPFIILFLIFTNIKTNLSDLFIRIKTIVYKLIKRLLVLYDISVPIILYDIRKILNYSRRNEVFL